MKDMNGNTRCETIKLRVDDICRSNCHIAPRAALHVRVVRGRHLYDTDHFNNIDPYVIVKRGPNESKSLAHLRAGTECDFDWFVALPFDPSSGGASGAPLELYVMDQNKGRRDVEVGRATVGYSRLIRHGEEANSCFRGSVVLTHKGFFSDVPAGELDIEFWWEQYPADQAFPVPLLHCVSNFNLAGGFMRKFLDGGKFKMFRTWQMNLWMLDAVFEGEACGWNRDYPAAQAIYGKGLKSAALRQAIRIQHSRLYSNDRRTALYEVMTINGIRDFVDMLPRTNPNTGRSVRFTYVILQNSSIHFSITNKRIVQDFLSKHALHAQASQTVVYAGEFFIDRKSRRAHESGRPALIFDNNSGTFAPPKEKLPRLQLLLEVNLGKALPILTLDRDDPLLKEYFEGNNIE